MMKQIYIYDAIVLCYDSLQFWLFCKDFLHITAFLGHLTSLQQTCTLAFHMSAHLTNIVFFQNIDVGMM